MTAQQNILLLNGSPKANGGTSGALAAYLKARLVQNGLRAEILRSKDCISSQEGAEKILSSLASADALVLAFPLYVDSLPYPLTRTLELIAERGKSVGVGKRVRLLAISNCGFPEAHQNETALAICRQFAGEIGMEWFGGLGLGGGQSIDGNLEKMGRLVRHVKKSLDLTADALAEDQPFPEEAARLMARPLMPRWFYLWMAARGGRSKTKQNGVWERINDRPYAN